MALVLYQGNSSNSNNNNGGQGSQEESFSDYYSLGASSVGGGNNTVSSGENGVKRFVGLANQGATCYLNGLLQTLFMTPEFRKAIFSWNYDPVKDGEVALCIPYQLQRLFGLLQLSTQRSVETVPLTKSFGWEGSEVFQQQDVQELTRVLFDALEDSFRGTKVENVIDELYAGELVDYLRCIDVDYQSERKDKFLDFSLAIVPFGSNTAMHSLTECIEMFLRPELLDGDNQYYVERFQKKVDAIKGLKFGKLPKLMSVQLKRFVYDFSGAYVVQKKLNDQVKFPMILNMNKYVAKKRIQKKKNINGKKETEDQQEENNGKDEEEKIEFEEIVNDDFEAFLKLQMEKLRQKDILVDTNESNGKSTAEATSSGAVESKETSSVYDDPSVPTLRDVTVDSSSTPEVTSLADHGKATSSRLREPDHDVVYESLSREKIAELVETQGEWIYELYAVLIHSGAISGGHYYAYIKDFASNQWYNFNDSSVTAIDEKTVQEAWGGSVTHSAYTGYTSYYSSYGTGTTSSYQSSANAYMLMYRQVTREVPTISNEIVPAYIQELVKEEQIKREAKLKEEEEFRNRLNIRVLWEGNEKIIPTKRTHTYDEFLRKVWEELELYKIISSPAPESKIDESEKVAEPTTTITTTTEGEINSSKETIPSPNFDLFRIRDYNHYTKLLLGGVDYDKSKEKTLSDLSFSDYKVYYLETRTPDEEWEQYYPDGFSVLLEEFDPMTLTFKEPRTVRLPYGATVIDFKEKIAKFISYDLSELRVMKMITLGFHDGKIEILDCDTRRLREDYFVYDGTKLYCEQASSISTPQESLAFESFLSLRNRLEIKYNVPPSEVTDRTLYVDSRWKVQDLRSKIAEELQIPVEKCRLFKLNAKSLELKDGDSSLSTNGLYNGITIAVTIGKATRAGFYPLSFSIYHALDTIVGVKYLPNLEPEIEEKSMTVEQFVKKYSPINLNESDEEEEDLYEDGIAKTTKIPFANATVKPTSEAEDALPDDYLNNWIVDESGIAEGQPVSDEGDNLSNKGVADDTLSNTDDFEDTPLAFADPVPDDEGNENNWGGAEVATEAIDVQVRLDQMSDWESRTNPLEPWLKDGTESSVPDDKKLNETRASEAVANALPGLDQSSPILEGDSTVSKPSESTTEQDNGENKDRNATNNSPSTTGTANTTVSSSGSSANNEPKPIMEIEPSDFGERMVKNTISLSQFEPLVLTEDICVQGTTMVDELRVTVTQELIRLGKLPEGTSPHRVRLRDRYSTNPGKILRDGKELTDLQIYLCDNKTLAIQILPEEEDIPDNDHGDVIVLVQRWNRSTWSLGERIEVLLPGSFTVRDVARGLAKLFSIPLSNLRVLVVPKENTFYLSELAQKAPSRNYGRAWFDPTEERKLMRYMSHDLRVQDGDLIVVQDINEPLMPLSPADLKSIEIVEAASNSTYAGSYYYGPAADYSRYGSNNVGTATASAYSYGTAAPVTSVGISTVPSTYRNQSQGIKIKTHKDRVKSNNDSLAATNQNHSTNLAETESQTTNTETNTNPDMEGPWMEEQIKQIEENIKDVFSENSGGGHQRVGNNSPVLEEGTTVTDDLFRMVTDPGHPEHRRFEENGGWEQYRFLQ